MRTNIEIDDALMKEALTEFGVRTKREAVEHALKTALRLSRQRRVLELKGVGWTGDLEAMRLD